jgi:hypothetical protein
MESTPQSRLHYLDDWHNLLDARRALASETSSQAQIAADVFSSRVFSGIMMPQTDACMPQAASAAPRLVEQCRRLGVPVLLVPLAASSELAVPVALFAGSPRERNSLRKTVIVETREALRERWHAIRASGDARAVCEFWRVHCAAGSEPDLECDDVWPVASRVQLRGAWSLLALALHDAGTAFELGGTLQWNGTFHASLRLPEERSRRDELRRFACALILKATLLNASHFPAEESDDEGMESTQSSGGRTTSAGGAAAQAMGTAHTPVARSPPPEHRRLQCSTMRHLLHRPGVVCVEGVGEVLLSDEVPSLLCDQRCCSHEPAGATRLGGAQQQQEEEQEEETQIQEEEEGMRSWRQVGAAEEEADDEEEDREHEHADKSSCRGINQMPASARAYLRGFAWQSVTWLSALGCRVLASSGIVASRVLGWPFRLAIPLRWLPRAAAGQRRAQREAAGSHRGACASAELQHERQQPRSVGEGAARPRPDAAASTALASSCAVCPPSDASATIAVDSRRAESIDRSSSTALESVPTALGSSGSKDWLQEVPLFSSRSCAQALTSSGASRDADRRSAPAPAHSFEVLSAARGCAVGGGVALCVGDGRHTPLCGISSPSQPPKFQTQLPAAAQTSPGAGQLFSAAGRLSRGASRGSLPSGPPQASTSAPELAAVPEGSRSSRLVVHSWKQPAALASKPVGSDETAPLRQALRMAVDEPASRDPCSSGGESVGSLPSSCSSSSSNRYRDRHLSDESDFYRLDQLMAETRPRSRAGPAAIAPAAHPQPGSPPPATAACAPSSP